MSGTGLAEESGTFSSLCQGCVNASRTLKDSCLSLLNLTITSRFRLRNQAYDEL
jgi:hypothetical protein